MPVNPQLSEIPAENNQEQPTGLETGGFLLLCLKEPNMSGIHHLPKEAIQTVDGQTFQKFCQEQLEKKAKHSGISVSEFKPDAVMVRNHAEGDGVFELAYLKPREDFFCQAKVNWLEEKMELKAGEPKQRLIRARKVVVMRDHDCSFLKESAGEMELGDSHCPGEAKPAALTPLSEKERQLTDALKMTATGLASYFLFYRPLLVQPARNWLQALQAKELVMSRPSPLLSSLRLAQQRFGAAYLFAWVFEKGMDLAGYSNSEFKTYGSVLAFSAGLSRRALPLAKTGNALLRVTALELPFLLFDNEEYKSMGRNPYLGTSSYESWVKQRLMERVNEGEDGVTLGIRGAVHFLVPRAMEWAIGMDHPEITEKILEDDRLQSEAIVEAMRNDLTSIPAEEFDAFLSSQEFEQAAAFLVAVEQEGNDWAREIFEEDGRLRFEGEEGLMKYLFGPEEFWPHWEERIALRKKRQVEQQAQALVHAEIAHSYGLEMINE